MISFSSSRSRLLIFSLVFLGFLTLAAGQHSKHRVKKATALQLSSPAFPPGGSIPKKFSCEGENVSPELRWKNAPPDTQTFALVVHDPDAPHAGGYTHWVAYNIPSAVNHIAENAPKEAALPGGGTQGKNDNGTLGYTAPCPPSGTHHYHFYLYALGSELDLQPGATVQDLDKAMEGRILGKAELIGRYGKSK